MPWSTLADLADRHHLRVLERVPGDLPASAPVQEGDDDRFEIGHADYAGALLDARRGHDPDVLLGRLLADARLREPGSGSVRVRLTDRFGGESVVLSDRPLSDDGEDPLAVLLDRLRGW